MGGRGILHGSGIVKLDLAKRQFVKKWEGGDCYSSEPLFIPRPGSTKEDDGVVVVTCINPDKSLPETNMVVLSPELKSLEEPSTKTLSPLLHFMVLGSSTCSIQSVSRLL